MTTKSMTTKSTSKTFSFTTLGGQVVRVTIERLSEEGIARVMATKKTGTHTALGGSISVRVERS